MIDIQPNTLFGIDDGAKNIDDSINVLKDAYRNGVTTCVLTPRCILHRRGDTQRFLDLRNESFEKIKELNLQFIPKLICGAKVLMDHDLSLHKDLKKLCIDDSKYLLIELPNFARIFDFDEWIYCLNMRGITPIIAHVERYPLWKELISSLTSTDVYFQVSASVFDKFFKRRIIKKLILAGKKFFVTSDVHNSTTRTFNLKKALEKAKRLFPKNYSTFFLSDFNFHE